MTTGLLLFAHGARDPEWARPFEAVLQSLQASRPECPAVLAFLEFMQPDMDSAGDQLVAAGCGSVSLIPLFLGTGGHVRKDVPRLLDALQARHPQVAWRLHSPIGDHPLVRQAMVDACLSTQ
jgi:sirohydrochlorin cobaltochelatase